VRPGEPITKRRPSRLDKLHSGSDCDDFINKGVRFPSRRPTCAVAQHSVGSHEFESACSTKHSRCGTRDNACACNDIATKPFFRIPRVCE
jgi:hypothetical protein